jgi:hypothetical protein
MHAGFPGELQTPNEAMFVMGTWSMIVATGAPAITSDPLGVTTKEQGILPNGHMSMAPSVTKGPIDEVAPPGHSAHQIKTGLPKWENLVDDRPKTPSR